jgi:hypothetical protein
MEYKSLYNTTKDKGLTSNSEYIYSAMSQIKEEDNLYKQYKNNMLHVTNTKPRENNLNMNKKGENESHHEAIVSMK